MNEFKPNNDLLIGSLLWIFLGNFIVIPMCVAVGSLMGELGLLFSPVLVLGALISGTIVAHRRGRPRLGNGFLVGFGISIALVVLAVGIICGGGARIH